MELAGILILMDAGAPGNAIDRRSKLRRMVEFVEVDDILVLRNQLLRGGKLDPGQCVFDGDKAPEAFHLGYFEKAILVGIASFLPQRRQGYEGVGFRLRGMAILDGFRRRGIGNLIVNFGLSHLKGKKVDYVWCDARKVAYSFYLDAGFEFISDEFDIPEIGPHRVMYLKLS